MLIDLLAKIKAPRKPHTKATRHRINNVIAAQCNPVQTLPCQTNPVSLDRHKAKVFCKPPRLFEPVEAIFDIGQTNM